MMTVKDFFLCYIEFQKVSNKKESRAENDHFLKDYANICRKNTKWCRKRDVFSRHIQYAVLL